MAFYVDRVGDLDREAIRESVIDRFSVERMTDGYEAIYREMLAPKGGEGRPVDLVPIGVMGSQATAADRVGDKAGATAGT